MEDAVTTATRLGNEFDPQARARYIEEVPRITEARLVRVIFPDEVVRPIVRIKHADGITTTYVNTFTGNVWRWFGELSQPDRLPVPGDPIDPVEPGSAWYVAVMGPALVCANRGDSSYAR